MGNGGERGRIKGGNYRELIPSPGISALRVQGSAPDARVLCPQEGAGGFDHYCHFDLKKHIEFSFPFHFDQKRGAGVQTHSQVSSSAPSPESSSR